MTWKILPEADVIEVKQLAKQLNDIDFTLCKILLQRGVSDFEKAKAFFRPSLKMLHDPFLMKDMSVAIDRLQTAIFKKEKILIYGDYDVDGTTSVALVYSFLHTSYPNLDYYIPDRYAEGYGISYQGIDFAKENGFTLIIALDCGIKAVDKVAYANDKGVDFIICDHHTPGDEIPAAIAVLDPKQKDCKYPFKELPGCGIGFKLMHAFAIKEGISFDKLATYLDILAVSICADIVPMRGENRILTHFGVKKLNKNPQASFQAMLNTAGVKKRELTVTDIVFTLAPRINAAGRMESGNKSVALMLSKNKKEAEDSSKKINEYNIDRRTYDQGITKEALAMIEGDEKLKKQKTTVLYKEDWHKGVIGIVASRCIESYYRPTIILTESKGVAAGSARSVKGFNVYNALEACSDLLEQFGGHKYAAGMTLPIENVPLFQQKFEAVVAASIPDGLLIPQIEIDSEIQLQDITEKFYRILKQFAPFGPENMRPVFLSRSLVEKGNGRLLKEKHLKLDVLHPNNPAVTFPAIGFNLFEQYEFVKSGEPFDMAYTIEQNEWNGKISIQLNIKDIKPAN